MFACASTARYTCTKLNSRSRVIGGFGHPKNDSALRLEAIITVTSGRGCRSTAAKQGAKAQSPKGRKDLIMWIVLDKHKKPLGHCDEKSARKLFSKRRACIYRYYPQVLILMDADVRDIKPVHHYRIKIDPGAQHTGITVVEEDRVILFIQVDHRGGQVVSNLKTRNSTRRNRRNRKTRYRRCKFPKGGKNAFQTPRPKGWLPPSQLSIKGNVVTWVNRLIRYLGPCDVSVELVKFDTQLMNNPDIEGEQYQQGTLYGYELKEYLKEKYANTCQYCSGKTEDHRLEWEHMIPKSRGGSDSVKNATLACHTCNQKKGDFTPEEWLSDIKRKPRKTELDQMRIECLECVIDGKIIGKGLRYAAWVNTTRWKLVNDIKSLVGVKDVELSTGGRTAYNRARLGVAKDHHLDAMCVGKTNPENGYRNTNQLVLYIKAFGRGTRLRGGINTCGIITNKWTDRTKRYQGLQTGDIVFVDTPNGKYAGTYTGRIMIRKSGSHDVRCLNGCLITGTRKSVYTIRQRSDGYAYQYKAA